MFHNNPFSLISDFASPLLLQVYVVLMILAVVIGTLYRRRSQGERQVLRAAAGEIECGCATATKGGPDLRARASKPSPKRQFPVSFANGRAGSPTC